MLHLSPDGNPTPEPIPETTSSECPPFVQVDTWKTFRDQLYRLPYDAIVVSDDLIFRIKRDTHRAILELLQLKPHQPPAISIVDIDGRDSLVATVRPAQWFADLPEERILPLAGTEPMPGESSMRFVADSGFQFLTCALSKGVVASRREDIEF